MSRPKKTAAIYQNKHGATGLNRKARRMAKKQTGSDDLPRAVNQPFVGKRKSIFEPVPND